MGLERLLETELKEIKRSNLLIALLIQVVVETHGNSLKYGTRLREIMDEKF